MRKKKKKRRGRKIGSGRPRVLHEVAPRGIKWLKFQGRAGCLSLNGVPLNEDALSVNDKFFFPTIKGKRKPARVALSFRG